MEQIKNPMKELWETLKKKGLFTQFKDYEDYCQQKGIKPDFKKPELEDEEKVRAEYFKNQKVELEPDEIRVEELFD